MTEAEQSRVDELADTMGIASESIKGIFIMENYWVVDNTNKILYSSSNRQFAHEAQLTDLFTLLYIPVGNKYTVFLSSNMYFLVVINEYCCDTDRI